MSLQNKFLTFLKLYSLYETFLKNTCLRQISRYICYIFLLVKFSFVKISIVKLFPSAKNKKIKFKAIYLNEMLTFTLFYSLTIFNMSFVGWERNPQPVFSPVTSSKNQKITLSIIVILVMNLILHC